MADARSIVYLTSEIYPFSKTGGLGDVLGALPLAMKKLGYNPMVITPFYGRLSTGGFKVRLVMEDLPVGYPWPSVTAEVYLADYHGVPVYFISRSEYFDRRLYYNTHKGDYFDNCERFNFFSRAAVNLMRLIDPKPAVVHANDWQTGLVPAYLHFAKREDPFWDDVRTVITIHNLAFQGRFSSRLFFECGLDHESWNQDGVEFYGDFNLLKAGIAYSDAITTVSPSYAEEILTPEFGCGLEGILNKRKDDLYGILNGADYHVWSPEDDKFLPCKYACESMSGKEVCKQVMIRELYLSDLLEDKPVLGFIGRLRGQKGIDLLIDILPELMQHELGVVVLGEGNLDFEAQLMHMMEEYQGRLSVQIGYTEDLAHLIQAGTDIFLMPSRYEPCGLTQMYAMRYGTPPVACAVGGLKDTITPYPAEGATGFIFDNFDTGSFLETIRQAVTLWSLDKAYWKRMIQRCMDLSFTWEKSAGKYVELYRRIGAVV